MAYYAFLDDNNQVIEVISGRDESDGDWETYYGQLRGHRCVRTSYNGNIRKQFAGIGYTYDQTADVFIRPQPFPSWTLDTNHDWQAPLARPTDGRDYYWNEAQQKWVLID